MKLKKIIRKVNSIVLNNDITLDNPITGITDDSREVKKGYLFVVKKGFKTNGEKYISDALKNEAAGIVSNKEYKNVPSIRVKDVYKFEQMVLSLLYNQIEKEFEFIGITGTKGKTTTAFIIYNYLRKINRNVFYIGSLGVYDKSGKNVSYRHETPTTPDIYDLYEILSKMGSTAHDIAVLEVSSHALDQRRVEGITFKATGFTNLTHEHLNYHENMGKYFEAKSLLFTNYNNDIAVINTYDKYGKKLYNKIQNKTSKIYTYGENNGRYLFKYQKDKKYNKIMVDNKIIKTKMIGRFNIYNVVMAYFILKSLNYFKNNRNIIGEKQIPGRLEELKYNKVRIFIDYAHSPDSLEKVLKLLNRLKKKRIITVFGCTGDRDRTKRPIMGEIAEKYSDFFIITSDDPHSEDPFSICKEVAEGVSRDYYIVEPDRKKAIYIALNKAKSFDIVLIAGKGHEQFQIFDNYKIPFSDKKVVQDFYKD